MVTLTGQSLTIDQVASVSRQGERVDIDPSAIERVERARAAVERHLATGEPLYGINTGFGKLASVRVPDDQLAELQRNLILSHVAGVGDPLPVDVVRAVMLLRANVLLMPTSGVRSEVARRLVAMLNAKIHPVIPEQGSVGASGDLAPLAHVAWAVIGEGDVTVGDVHGSPFTVHRPTQRSTVNGQQSTSIPAAAALAEAGIEPLTFAPKEGLSFINGTQAQTAILVLLVHDAGTLWRTANAAAAMSVEALMATPVPFDARFHELRRHPHQARSAELLRAHLADSQIREAHRTDDPRVQDAYSLRCTPQILGAAGDAIEYASRVAEIELNAATDNPLVFGDDILSGGNFHGQPIAQALDVLTIGLTTLQGVAERRLDRLMNPDLSHGLPAFLTKHPGLHSGLMMLQITAAALVAESRALAAPASVQSIPTDGNQEDFVPMGMAAAFKARRVFDNARRVVAAELIAAAQGLEFRRPLKPGRGVQRVYTSVRELVPPLDADRPLTPDVERVAAALIEGAVE
jgi:histidine ammonia-lyase